jgi:hypothetical protein
VVFGGFGYLMDGNTGTAALNDTWVYNGAWVKKIALNTAGSPTARAGGAMGFDPVRGVTVLFGGDNWVGASFGDTWEWDGTSWKQAAPTASPPPMTNASMIWDAKGKRLILAGSSATTYAYDGTTWTPLSSSGWLRRSLSAIAYDSKRSTFVAFGGDGTLNANPPYSIYADTVTWAETACVSGADCGAGSCIAGTCCSTPCAGACQTCGNSGSCGTLAAGIASPDPSCPYLCNGGADCPTSCGADTDCQSGAACIGGACQFKRPVGATCNLAKQCLSNACVDGFCCDRACGGQCEACDLSGAAGHCGPIPKNTTPHGARGACAGAGLCAGACDGSSAACQFPGASVVCSPARCSAGKQTTETRCDGFGACPALGKVDCAPYACGATTCDTACTTDAECAATAYCTSNRCVPKIPDGGVCDEDRACISGVCNASGACGPTVVDAGADASPDAASEAGPDAATEAGTDAAADAATETEPDTATDALPEAPASDGAPPDGWPAPGEPPKVSTGGYQSCRFDSECSTGFCVDGVCCDSRCDQPCHSCALLTAPGKCQAEPYGIDLRQECGRPLECIGTCSGSGTCIGAGPGTLCARNRCTSPTGGVGAAYCATAGVPCPTGEVVSFECAPFACDPAFGACKTTCVTSDDCAPGLTCDDAKHQCTQPAPTGGGDDGGCAVTEAAPNGARSERALLTTALALAGLLLGRRRARR